MKINIDEIKVHKSEDHTNLIKLDNLMMEMKYPSLEQFVKNNFDAEEENLMEQSFKLITSCIDKIFSGEEVWTASDCTEEMNDFLEQMNSQQFKEVEKFFETMPKLSHKVTVKNPNTDVESEVIWGTIGFRIGTVHMDLESYYRLNFSLMQYHKYSLTEIENMIPGEDVYIEYLRQHLEEEKLKQQQQQGA